MSPVQRQAFHLAGESALRASQLTRLLDLIVRDAIHRFKEGS